MSDERAPAAAGSGTLRAAMTQTVNAFREMPERVEDVGRLDGRLDELRAANVVRQVELLREAAGLGARVACLGELCTAPYFALHEHPLWHALAEDARQGPSVLALADAARELGLVVIAPIYERAGERRFNTAVVLDEHGGWLGCYRKIHVPSGRNERAGFHETFYYEGSDGRMPTTPADVSDNPFLPVFATSVGRIGIATCYDRHFPDVVATLAAQGAQLVFSPAATFGEASRRLWELEFPVDAARHRVYVGGSNRLGAEPPWNVEYYGAGYFVGPRGRLAELSPRPELVLADLDLDALACPDASGWNLARDARPEVRSARKPEA
jgi:N-carbamoylputrescine amidase